MEETFKIIESNPALTPQPNHGTELPHPVFSKHIQAALPIVIILLREVLSPSLHIQFINQSGGKQKY